MTTLLILTGPQGSGNHLFSKIFALHPGVSGWGALLDTHWIGHDQEPFADYWNNPSLLQDKDWSSHDYWVTSISCPYANHGVVTVPNYSEFIDTVQELGIKVKIAIIGRDRNILQYQQHRVRDRISLPEFEQQLPYIRTLDSVYVSHELLNLYGAHYIESISAWLDFPVNTDDPRFNDIIKEDTNSKYFSPAETQDLDAFVRHVSGLKPK